MLTVSRVAHQQSGRLLWMKSARRVSAPDCSHPRRPRRGSDGPCSPWPAASDLTAIRRRNHTSCKQPTHKQASLTQSRKHTLTCFWFAVLEAEDLSVVGLHFQNLLHAAEVMNSAGHKFIFSFRMEVTSGSHQSQF